MTFTINNIDACSSKFKNKKQQFIYEPKQKDNKQDEFTNIFDAEKQKVLDKVVLTDDKVGSWKFYPKV